MSSPRPTTSTIKLVFDEDDASFLFSSPSCEQPSMVLNIDETCSDTDLDELLDDEFPGSRVYRATVRSSKPGTAHDTPTIGMQLAVKLAAGAPAVRRIRHEALIYEKLLHQLQGTVVPQFYGMFTITVEGEEFGCLVMEWCEAPPTRPRSWPEIARKEILAVCRLHRLGIEHGGLDALGHVLLAPDGNVRLVSFSRAKLHRCAGGYPLLYNEKPGEIPLGCWELFETEIRLAWRCGCLSRTRLPGRGFGSVRCGTVEEIDISQLHI